MTSVLLLSVGIFLGSFPLDALAAGIGTSSSKLYIPRIGINRSSKDNGGSLSYTGAEYATHRPYKVYFDLLQASDRSHELEMPLIRNNDILDESEDKDSYFMLALDPTLRSRRRRRRQVETQQQQQFPPQQQQVPFQQLGVFQGPIPVQRQRPQYDNIHTKYPYPYPPTDVQTPVQVVVPESGASEPEENVEISNGGVSTDPTQPPPTSSPPPSPTSPPEISQTTLLPEASAPVDQQQQGASQQDPAPAPPANFPDSPHQQQPQEPPGSEEPVQTTTYNPSGMISSSPQPPPSPTSPPSQGQQPPQAGGLPVSPGGQNGPDSVPQLPPVPDHVMQKKLREQEEQIRRLQSQVDQANLQVASYEQENNMVKDQFMRSEEANIKLRDRILQLENTNQHLQEQNGQLQQVTAEQRQQINGLKDSVKDVTDQLSNYQNQVPQLSQEAQNHRKEIEDFLIRIRQLGEENDNCKKQVRLYQLKVNYITEQHRAQTEQLKQQLPAQQQQQQQQQQQPQKKKQPIAASLPQKKKPQLPSAADLVTVLVDDELDPELSRMDAEIAALQKNADEVAAAIQNLPLPPVPENLSSPVVAAVAIPESPIPPASAAGKKENEFPGEAVQVDPQQTKHKQQQGSDQKIDPAADAVPLESSSRSRTMGSAPVWEQPAGF